MLNTLDRAIAEIDARGKAAAAKDKADAERIAADRRHQFLAAQVAQLKAPKITGYGEAGGMQALYAIMRREQPLYLQALNLMRARDMQLRGFHADARRLIDKAKGFARDPRFVRLEKGAA